MVDISLATVANSATVPSILPRSAKWAKWKRNIHFMNIANSDFI